MRILTQLRLVQTSSQELPFGQFSTCAYPIILLYSLKKHLRTGDSPFNARLKRVFLKNMASEFRWQDFASFEFHCANAPVRKECLPSTWANVNQPQNTH